MVFKDLNYVYQGKRIPLIVCQDTSAVAFKSEAGPRGSTKPFYLQLQQALQFGTRGGTPDVDVQPSGEHYALVTLPSARGETTGLEHQVQQQPYVETTLPVLTRRDQNDTIVLPNEIIVSFQPNLSKRQQQAILDRNQLDLIRPLRFTQSRYLVRARNTAGTALLAVSDQLNQVTGIQSATPNFIQALKPDRARSVNFSLDQPPAASSLLKGLVVESPNDTSFQTSLLPLQWHLNSTAMLQQLAPKRRQSLQVRPDVHTTEAWQHSQAGQGVVVAVLDSLIQWDHPALIGNVYTVRNRADQLPGEVHGWDFSSENGGDPDTRISDAELNLLRSQFQDTFRLSDSELEVSLAVCSASASPPECLT